jgi:tetratricopeptide (TPR) repeat protein/tRNA A-37 threonylcarbamoyl transferase component Bud32
MADQLDRLKAALADRYRIERELGSGGMATVYLADDLKLHRKVALKVLRPELAAALGPDRFLQEIDIAAKLTHPHILPLHDCGDADGFLYYVMPHIDGESLRDKLAHEGELPIGEAVRILRDVVDALSEAHEHGVVHRDIKPDNVLLAKHHALVTDFGVAKAVSEATGAQKLTTDGVALGTPAYMSPEQAAADRHIDHRADIYAVGALAYELLTGRPPFTGTTPQEVLAAHVTQAPDPVTKYRESVPPALEQLVMKCLEKRAADRWQSADELLPLLEVLATPSGGMTPTGSQPVATLDHEVVAGRTHPVRVAALYALAAIGILAIVYLLMLLLGLPSWVIPAASALLAIGLPLMLLTGHHERRRSVAVATGRHVPTPTGLVRHFTWPKVLTASAAACAALAVGTGAYMGMRVLGVGPVGTLVATGVLEERGRLLVAQFENRTADSGLGISVTEALRIDLQQSPAVRVVRSNAIAPVLERMGRSPNATIDLELAREVAEREGIRAVVAGEIGTLGTGYVLSARVISASDGAELVALRETADDEAEIIASLDRLSARLRERIGESFRSIRRSEPLERVSTNSLEALRLYSRGAAAEDAGDYDRAMQFLGDAVALDTAFAMAYRKLSVVLSNAGAPESRQNETAARAFAVRERLPLVERYMAEAWYYDEVENDRAKTASAYRSVLDLDPEHETALNNLAVALAGMRRWAEAEELYQRAMILSDSTVWQHFFNSAGAQLAQGDTTEALATIAAFADRLPGHPELYFARAAAAMALLDYEAALVHLDSMREVGRGAAPIERDWARLSGGVYVTLGKLADAGRVSSRRATADRELGYTHPALRRAITRASLTAQLPGFGDAAAAMLDSALQRYSLVDIPVPDRPYDRLIQAYARSGRPNRARSLYDEWEREVPANLRTAAAQYLTRGYLSLSEGAPEAAVEEFRAYYDEVSCTACALYPLGRAYDVLGNVDSALTVMSRGLDLPDPYRGTTDWLWRAPTLVRVGELHEAAGEHGLAVARYNELMELWRDADPELQMFVQDIRARIARLVREPRR